jgi:hypothetical protein
VKSNTRPGLSPQQKRIIKIAALGVLTFTLRKSPQGRILLAGGSYLLKNLKKAA